MPQDAQDQQYFSGFSLSFDSGIAEEFGVPAAILTNLILRSRGVTRHYLPKLKNYEGK